MKYLNLRIGLIALAMCSCDDNSTNVESSNNYSSSSEYILQTSSSSNDVVESSSSSRISMSSSVNISSSGITSSSSIIISSSSIIELSSSSISAKRVCSYNETNMILECEEQPYKVTKIGTQIWMAENMNVPTDSGSWCYSNNASCGGYGRLYNWETAKNICPEDWHLPASSDWRILEKFAGGPVVAGDKLKSTEGWAVYDGVTPTDLYGFSALPAGDYLKSSFAYIGYQGKWWTSSYDDYDDVAYYWLLDYRTSLLNVKSIDTSYGFSVRCVHD